MVEDVEEDKEEDTKNLMLWMYKCH